ncbi:uncharacterized protein VP01_191g14 [Puccinia sorghi]|uniref:Uncharacterized protein n=2 Tax=Puccinia sorghi TaxID=27349 RepID=A0A0L6VEH4_9BASI|nr:uncharacterized protein VP01_191g14 [Puccinia sorghi]
MSQTHLAFPAFLLKRSSTDKSQQELLLIEACQIYGLGIWRDIADHMGTGGPRRRVSVVEAG